MTNSDVPTQEEWERLDPKIQDFERHRILISLDKRLAILEGRKWVNGLLTIGGAFLGGGGVVGMALLGKLLL